MKILFVSDLHYFHPWFEWVLKEVPAYDLLVLGGDLLDHNDPTPRARQVESVSAWIREIRGPICISSGNHDRRWDSRQNRWLPAHWLTRLSRDDLRAGGAVAVFDGLSILTTEYREPLEDPSAAVWITHNPPADSGVGRSADGWDGGDVGLGESLRVHRPALLLCGHVHEPMRWHDLVGDTLCINVGMNRHARVPNHVLLDTEAGTAERYSETDRMPRLEKLDFAAEFPAVAERLNPAVTVGSNYK